MTPELFTTDLGVCVLFLGSRPVEVQRAERPESTDAGGVFRPGDGKRLPHPERPLAPTLPPSPLPRISTLSYTALSTYEQCGYRFYVQRVLGLPDLPTPIPAGAAPAEERPAARPAPARPGLSGAERGTLIHQLLAGMDLRSPSLRDSMPADVRALLVGLVGSATFARLAGLPRRAPRAAFRVPRR